MRRTQKPAHLRDPRAWLDAYDAEVQRVRKPEEFSVRYEDGYQMAQALRRAARQPDWDPAYAHDMIDMAEYHDDQECRTLDDVRKVIEALRALPEVTDVPGHDKPVPGAYVYDVVHRVYIRDSTPMGDPPGLLWDWDDDFDWTQPEWLVKLLRE